MKRIFVVSIFLLSLFRTSAQVNLQTGSAVFSLPIFNWQDDKSRLQSVVALNYSSGNGLKVNDVASNVGQGWNLVAGGVITRMQVGEPDDQPAFTPTTDQDYKQLSKIPPGYLYTSVPIAQGCPIALTQYPIFPSKNQIYTQNNSVASDKQLDYFSFQFNGKSGIFVLDRASGTGRPLGDSKLIISFQKGPNPVNPDIYGTRTTIQSFTIQDVDGLSYVFSVPGKTKVLKTDYCMPTSTNQQKVIAQPTFKGGRVYYQFGHDDGTILNPFVTDDWFLSEIDDRLTGRRVTFTYTQASPLHYPAVNDAGADVSYYRNSDYAMVSYKKSVTQNQDLSSITYPDGHTVVFNYAKTDRTDLVGSRAISYIDVLYSNRTLSRYLLTTKYLIRNKCGIPGSDGEKRDARLCLKSVQKIGIDLKESTPPYIFDYFTGAGGDDIVPPPFSYAKDIWGYYNGNNSVADDGITPITLDAPAAQLNYHQIKGLCHFLGSNPTSLLNAKANYAQNGLLKQVIYPTGGTLNYQYAQNTGAFDVSGSTAMQTVGGVHVVQTSSTDGGFSNGCANPIVTQYSYVLSGSGNSSLWGLEQPMNTMKTSSHYAKDVHGFKFLPPSCKWKYQYPGILSLTDAVDLQGVQHLLAAIGPALDVVGVIGDIYDVVNLVCYSSGVLAWAAVIVDVIGIIVDIIITCNSGSKDNEQNVYYTGNLNDVSPLPTQFKRVEVTESSGAIGKTVYEFTSTDDYGLWRAKNDNFANLQRFAPWAYGLPKKTTVYDAGGNPVKMDICVYNFGSNNYAGLNRVDLSLPSYKCTVKQSSSQRSDFWSDPSKYNAVANYSTDTSRSDIGITPYSMYTGRTLLDTLYERVYKQGSATQYDVTTTGYYYNTGNYEVAQSFTIQSNGDIIRKYFNYSNDYHTGVYTTLAGTNGVNAIALPVEAITNVYRASGAGNPGSSASASRQAQARASKTDTTQGVQTNELGDGPGLKGTLTHKITEYGLTSNGDIKPTRIFEERFAQPGNWVSYDPASATPASYKTAQVFSYSNDPSSNLIGLQDEGGRNVTNIWDYGVHLDKYVVASVINASSASDKCSYTSFETSSLGGWALTGSGTASATSGAITGTQSYTLTSGSKLSVSPNTAKSYILSFWAAGGGMSVTGGSLVKSGPTYNGFTYYEYSIPVSTTSVTVSGTTAIDELRLYPANARMRTTTYDPLVGKTSECDENNRITYYEYDNLGRLLFVKDEGKNALKMYEYNNISPAKQTGCPVAATYSSHAFSETFISTACTTNQLADTTVYGVAAGAYTSTISQEDADIKAESDVLTNGQAYANSHGNCRTIYRNAALSSTDSTQSCDAGYKPGVVTYTVPAGTYSSIISQADADRQAAEDTAANAQAYANADNTRSCTFTTDPDWTWFAGDPIQCQVVGGSTHEMIQMRDINPNSSSYNTTVWKDVGSPPTDACPIGATISGATSVTVGQSSGTGNITAASGYTVTVTVTASGTPSNAITATMSVNGVSITGSNTVTNTNNQASSTFTFVMPASGSVTYTLSVSYTPNSGAQGNGSVTVQ